MEIRHGGLALMIGVVMVILASLFLPGVGIVNPVDQTDFPAALRAMGESPILAHWMTFANVIALLLLSFGALALFPLALRQGGLGGRLLQFGIIISVIEWLVLVIGSGMRHFEVHLLQRASLNDDSSLSPADFESAALTVHTDMAAILLTFMILFPLATMMLGYGLSKRFDSMDLFKGASYVMALGGVVGMVLFLTAMNYPELGIRPLFTVNSVVLYIQSICLFIIGYGMYKGQKGLAEEASPG